MNRNYDEQQLSERDPRWRDRRYGDRDGTAFGPNDQRDYRPPYEGTSDRRFREQATSYMYGDVPYRTANTSGFERGFDQTSMRGGFEGRGWMDKTYDEVARWFGDEAAERRRQIDEFMEAKRNNRGKGPKNYMRSDERIKENVSDLLWDNDLLDASDLSVEVSNGEVTLKGVIGSRFDKYLAEGIAESVIGVKDVINIARIRSTNDVPAALREDPANSRNKAASAKA